MQVNFSPQFAARVIKSNPVAVLDAVIAELQRTSGHDSPLYGTTGFQQVHILKRVGPTTEAVLGYRLMAVLNPSLSGRVSKPIPLFKIPSFHHGVTPKDIKVIASDIRRKYGQILQKLEITPPPVMMSVKRQGPFSRLNRFRRASSITSS